MSTTDAPILLLNNDASIQEQDLLQLAATLERHSDGASRHSDGASRHSDGASRHSDGARCGFVGPLLFDMNKKEKLLSAGGIDIARHIHTHIRQLDADGGTPAGEPVREVAYVPGTAVLISPRVFRTVGLFDPDYFFSGEMADLCERAKQHGYRSVIDTRARAHHAQHDVSNLRETLYTYYSLRNRFLFISKHRRPQRIPLYCLWTFYDLGMALQAILQNRPQITRAICLALLDGLRGQFGGQNKRVLATMSDFGRRRTTTPSKSPNPT
jgi:GT2 family glycosyltransferase